MKLIVFCLLTVCWFSLGSTNQTDNLRKLQEILHQLKIIEKTVKVSLSAPGFYNAFTLVVAFFIQTRFPPCLAEQRSDGEYAATEHRGKQRYFCLMIESLVRATNIVIAPL